MHHSNLTRAKLPNRNRASVQPAPVASLTDGAQAAAEPGGQPPAAREAAAYEPPLLSSEAKVATKYKKTRRRVHLMADRIEIVSLGKAPRLLRSFPLEQITALLAGKKEAGLVFVTEAKHQVGLLFDEPKRRDDWVGLLRELKGGVSYYLRNVLLAGRSVFNKSVKKKRGSAYVITKHCLYVLEPKEDLDLFVTQTYVDRAKAVSHFYSAIQRVFLIRDLKITIETKKNTANMNKKVGKSQMVLITTNADKLIFADQLENLNILKHKIDKVMNDAEIQSHLDKLVALTAKKANTANLEKEYTLIDIMPIDSFFAELSVVAVSQHNLNETPQPMIKGYGDSLRDTSDALPPLAPEGAAEAVARGPGSAASLRGTQQGSARSQQQTGRLSNSQPFSLLRLRRSEVAKWTAGEVADWAEYQSKKLAECRERIVAMGLDGEMLLECLTEEALKEVVENPLMRPFLWQRVRELREVIQ